MNATIISVVSFVIATGFNSPEVPVKKPVGPTRVAVVNIGRVFSYFDHRNRWNALSLMSQVHKRHDEINQITTNIALWQTTLNNSDFRDDAKWHLHLCITRAKKRSAELDAEIKCLLEKYQEESLTRHWTEIQGAVKAYAEQHGIHIVLSYGEPLEIELLNALPNINRKNQAIDTGASVPLLFRNSEDITDGVMNMMRKRRREKQE